jgi:hypothetical protein
MAVRQPSSWPTIQLGAKQLATEPGIQPDSANQTASQALSINKEALNPKHPLLYQ